MEINDLVVESLKRAHGLSERIWTIENAEKYSTLHSGASVKNHRISEEIFSLMTSLNNEGMTCADVCAAPDGQGSLSQTLRAVARELAVLVGQDRLHYVELGPEPVKTSTLIRSLRDGGVHPTDYTAIDINESSHAIMRDAVVPLLPGTHGFNYLAQDFRDVQRQHIECGQDVTLITMLGFQEGNELPGTIGDLIQRVGGKRTYVLSEMQLTTQLNDDHIHRFYEHECMRRFSDLIGLKLGFEKRADHRVIVSEIEYNEVRYRVAVTLLPVCDGHEQGYLLTNVCLKYTQEQFLRVRQHYGGYQVIGEYCSGDNSVIYQLAEYCKA